MNSSLLRSLSIALVICTLPVVLSSCVSTGGYYDDGGIGAVYYEPPDVVYGGWGPSYHVAPYRGGDHRDYRPTSDRGHESARTYRAAPASRSVPSIPSQSRSSGSHSGGSHSSGQRSR